MHREQRRPATERNDIWSMEFVADELTRGRKLRTLTVLDLFTRQIEAWRQDYNEHQPPGSQGAEPQ